MIEYIILLGVVSFVVLGAVFSFGSVLADNYGRTRGAILIPYP